MKIGDLVKFVRGKWSGVGIITRAHTSVPSSKIKPETCANTLFVVQWSHNMGEGSHWDYELEVIDGNR